MAKAKKPTKSVEKPVDMIQSYKPMQSEVNLSSHVYIPLRNLGGWNENKQVLIPMQFTAMKDDYAPTQYALDCITLAIEAGVVDANRLLETAFSTRDDFDAFIKALRGYGETYWVNERHFHALRELVGDETYAKTYADAADTLEEIYNA